MDVLTLTSKYTNAVLVAVLPYVQDCIHRLHLPVVMPTNTEAISIKPYFRPDDVVAWLQIDDWAFVFDHGRVGEVKQVMTPPGKSTIKSDVSDATAIGIAQKTLESLGYDLEVLWADQKPRIRRNPLNGSITLEWISPGNGQSAEVSTDVKGRLISVDVGNPNTWLPPPKIEVDGVLTSTLPGSSVLRPVNGSDRDVLLPQALEKISEYQKAILPGESPFKKEDVIQFDCNRWGKYAVCKVRFTNQVEFAFEYGFIVKYFAADSLVRIGHRLRLRDVSGEGKLGEKEVFEVVRNALAKLAYTKGEIDLLTATAKARKITGKAQEIRRLFLSSSSANSQLFAEVDTVSGEIKALHADVAQKRKPFF